MVLYAPFAVLDIDVVETPDEPGEIPEADDVELSYYPVVGRCGYIFRFRDNRSVAKSNPFRYTSG
jgi:hypothetical protein